MALLEVEDLHTRFRTDDGVVQAVSGVTFSVERGETLGVVGESGSGKSVTFLTVMGLVDRRHADVSGSVRFDGEQILGASDARLQRIRGRRIGMIFQDPMTSLNPVKRIGWQLEEAVLLHHDVTRAEARRRAIEILKEVEIPRAETRVDDYPHQFSGGMRQRVMIAMALINNPEVLIADEPTTALDVTIQAQILELLRKLQRERGMSILLITHDLGVVAENADVVAVMYASRVVEFATVEGLFDRPRHPYTEGLFRSVPKLGDTSERLATIPGQVPNPARFPSGCKFHPRCPRTREIAANSKPEEVVKVGGTPVMRVCVENEPALRETTAGHWGACHFIDHFAQAPVTLPRLDHRREVTAAVAVDGNEVKAPVMQEVSR